MLLCLLGEDSCIRLLPSRASRMPAYGRSTYKSSYWAWVWTQVSHTPGQCPNHQSTRFLTHSRALCLWWRCLCAVDVPLLASLLNKEEVSSTGWSLCSAPEPSTQDKMGYSCGLCPTGSSPGAEERFQGDKWDVYHSEGKMYWEAKKWSLCVMCEAWQDSFWVRTPQSWYKTVQYFPGIPPLFSVSKPWLSWKLVLLCSPMIWGHVWSFCF